MPEPVNDWMHCPSVWVAVKHRREVLTDVEWERLFSLIEECRPQGKTQHYDLRRMIETIVWRHQNGAKWRSIPPEMVPWRNAAQTFIDNRR